MTAGAGRPVILCLNGGSSSIRFAVYAVGTALERQLAGKIERIGLPGTQLVVTGPAPPGAPPQPIGAADAAQATAFLLDWLKSQPACAALSAISHRLVHGMSHSLPERVTPALLGELRAIIPYDPDHLPGEIALLEACGRAHPGIPQVACFDTAFHRTLPPLARLLPIPRRFAAQGVVRYGFHGLSYAYLMQELRRLGDPAARRGRVILAHLGNGASLAAVRDGRSVDTTMGFTPAGGLVMSTRTGDLDPGIAGYFARAEQMSAGQIQHLINHESGLLGISETSSDLRDLEARAPTDARAAEALGIFCYQAKKGIGAYAAALGGLDTLVFAGGIGENSPLARAQICAELEFLGLALDPERNGASAPVISPDGSRATVRVIRTNEEAMLAELAARLLPLGNLPAPNL